MEIASKLSEVISMNFPGLEGEWRSLRIPICVIPKKFVATGETFDDIMEIIVWCLQHMAIGLWPKSRHDKKAWQPGDEVRKRKAGEPLKIHGALVEVRGDWVMMKETFHMPGHNEKAGCCWLCKATPDNFRDASSTAPWREQRLSHWELLERIIGLGHDLSPLLSAPGLKAHCFKIDWLHAVDIGVAADFLGNLFWVLVQKMEGSNSKARIKALFALIKTFYEENDVQERLPTLTANMIKKKKAPPKLRAKAAEARALIPFAKSICERLLDDGDVVEHSIKQMSRHLASLYSTLSGATIFRQDLMAMHCQKFCMLYTGLEERHRDSKHHLFRIKPKFHLMEELCEMTDGAAPSLSWCYRDEDFGGSVAAMAHRRGGKCSVHGVSPNFLKKWAGKFDVPAIL